MASDKSGMPPGREGQCEARIKTCRSCKIRFAKGDKSWQCHSCGESRRCTNDSLEARTACRVHGGKGGRPPTETKFKIANVWAEGYAHAINHPDLMSLKPEIALLSSRTSQLMERLNEVDISAVHKPALAAVEMIEEGIISANNTMTARGLRALREALDPISIEYSIYYQLVNNFDLNRRLTEAEHKFAADNKKTIDLALMLEVMIVITMIGMKYIATHQDRAAYARELQRYFPSGTDITVSA